VQLPGLYSPVAITGYTQGSLFHTSRRRLSQKRARIFGFSISLLLTSKVSSSKDAMDYPGLPAWPVAVHGWTRQYHPYHVANWQCVAMHPSAEPCLYVGSAVPVKLSFSVGAIDFIISINQISISSPC